MREHAPRRPYRGGFVSSNVKNPVPQQPPLVLRAKASSGGISKRGLMESSTPLATAVFAAFAEVGWLQE